MYGLPVTLCSWFLAMVVSALQEGLPRNGVAETDQDHLTEVLYRAGHLAEARPRLEEALELRRRTLGEDHPETAAARSRLALLLYAQGDLTSAARQSFYSLRIYLPLNPDLSPEAPAALEKAYEVLLEGLDSASREDLVEGRTAMRSVIEVLGRAPGDSPEALSVVRAAGFWLISSWASMLGDVAIWSEALESALELRTAVLPADHLELARLRLEKGVYCSFVGRTDEAEELFNRALTVFLTDPAPDYEDLIRSYLGLARLANLRGDLKGNRELIDLAKVAVPRDLPEKHPIRRRLMIADAAYLLDIGELQQARELQEEVVLTRWEGVPTHDRLMLRARSALAETLAMLGNLREAELLLEDVVETYSRILAPNHLSLQIARAELAEILYLMGRLEEALELERVTLPILETLVPPMDPLLIMARIKHAATLRGLGQLPEARRIEEGALEAVEAFPESDPVVLAVRASMAITLGTLGTEEGLQESLELNGKVLKVLEESLPADHVQVEIARGNQIFTLLELKRRAEAKSLLLEHIGALTAGLHSTALSMSPAEAEAIASSKKAEISRTLSMAAGIGIVDPFHDLDEDCFALVEQARCIGLLSAIVEQRQGEDERVEALRRTIRRCSVTVARANSDSGAHPAVLERERAYREMRKLFAEPGDGDPLSKPIRSEDLARSLDEDEAIIGYWRYLAVERSPLISAPPGGGPRLLAFVVRKNRPLLRIDLGRQWSIQRAVKRWRECLAGELALSETRGSAEYKAARASLKVRGERIRELILDPLLPHLEGVERLIVAPDDILHLVPIDALPLKGGLVGETYAVELRLTLWELLLPREPSSKNELFLAVGGVDYGPSTSASIAAVESSARLDGEQGGRLDQGAQPGGRPDFPYLTGTVDEVERIIETFLLQRWGRMRVLEGFAPSPRALLEQAPSARVLHVATHGWVNRAQVDIEGSPRGHRDLLDPAPPLRPMAHCWLALAGANRPGELGGPGDGVVTAEELATWPLGGCELAVLSACDTNAGERNAGQGVASFQKALRMAGVRTTITSLWRADDISTAELMEEFYRLWLTRSKGTSIGDCLWQAKMSLRRDRAPKAHWAGWVLSGEDD